MSAFARGTDLFLALGAVAALAALNCSGEIGLGNDPTSGPTTTTGAGGTTTSANGGSSTASLSTTVVGPGPGGAGGQSTVGPGGAGSGGVGGAATGGSGGAGGGPVLGVDCTPPMGNPGNLQLTPVIPSGLTDPLQVAVPKGDPDRMFIIEQAGRIRLWKNNILTTFLDINPIVLGGGEQGLLGLAFHPSYATNGRYFVHYSDNSGDTVIAEYARSMNNPDLSNTTAVATILTVNQPFSNHNGGSIEFNPMDGFLYIGLGDGGSGGDPQNHGQNINSLLGKLLRLNIDSTPPYTIPPGNLVGGAPEVYDWGLRNPYRWTFDVCTGNRYIGDVGQNAWEEVSVAANGDGNKNFGWRIMEGDACYNPNPGCITTGLTLPAHDYSHNQGDCTVIGGYVYRGSAIPWLRGAYIYADYCSGRIWKLRWTNGMVSDQSLLFDTTHAISGFGQDNNGEIYLLALNSDVMYRLDPM